MVFVSPSLRHVGNHGHAFDDSVDESVLQHLLGVQPEVALAVGGDLLHRVPGGLRIEVVAYILDALHLPREDLEVGGLPLEAADAALVHQVLGVRKREAAALGAAAGDHAAHAGGLADDVRRDRAGHEAHGVHDAEAAGDAATGAVHVEMDVGLRVLVGQEQQLRQQSWQNAFVCRN